MDSGKEEEPAQDKIKKTSERAQKLLPLEERSLDFEHGVHRYQFGNEMVVAVSAQTWADFTDSLSKVAADDRLVVSPELMTFTGQPLDELMDTRQIIENRVEELKEASKEHPQALFLLGTPTFPPKGKPRNSVLFIKNGREVGQTNKRSGATQTERENFDLLAEEQAVLVPGTNIGILICADLPTITIFRSDNEDDLLRLLGRENFIGKTPTFIHPKARSLLVVSCWGVGGNRDFMRLGEANTYYLAQLRGVVAHIMRVYPQIEEVLQVDRTPLMEKDDLPYTPTHPFNAHFQQKH